MHKSDNTGCDILVIANEIATLTQLHSEYYQPVQVDFHTEWFTFKLENTIISDRCTARFQTCLHTKR